MVASGFAGSSAVSAGCSIPFCLVIAASLSTLSALSMTALSAVSPFDARRSFLSSVSAVFSSAFASCLSSSLPAVLSLLSFSLSLPASLCSSLSSPSLLLLRELDRARLSVRETDCGCGCLSG